MRLGKTVKSVSADGRLTLERRMIGCHQLLTLRRSVCVGCGDCETACPAQAIHSSDPWVEAGGLSERAVVEIDENACHFCGLCTVVCPTKALAWQEDGEEVPILQRDGLVPLLLERIEIDVARCRSDCNSVCETRCPVDAVRVRLEPLDDGGPDRVASVDVDRRLCFYCHKCEEACPHAAISVRHARHGIALFRPEHCPEGCRACADVCPTEAMSARDGSVRLEERLCIFCRACRSVCPVPEALEIRREAILHRPVRSHLWAQLQGKLVSRQAKLRLMEEAARRKLERAHRTRID